MPGDRGLLRIKSGHHHRVSAVELFFDLVFVFAVTQLSHLLVEHFTPLGAAETLLLTLAVWWVWMYTAWVHELARSGEAAGVLHDAGADGRGADSVGVDPQGVRSTRAGVCRGLRRHSGGAHGVLPVGGARARSADPELPADLRLAGGCGGVVDRGCLRRGCPTCRAVGARVQRRVRGAGGRRSGRRVSGDRRPRTGTSRAVTWPSARCCSSSSRSASPCS